MPWIGTTERRISSSGIKIRRTLESFDWAFQPKLSRAAIEELAGHLLESWWRRL